MYFNWARRELNMKIVYYGPSYSGKTTTLQYVHAKTAPTLRSDLVMLKTREDRTLFFDFMQLSLGRIKGLKPKFNLYTVPGQAYYIASRRIVLQGVDGVIFVADSQGHRLADNLEHLTGLKRSMIALGHNLENLPLVLQCNKQDLPGVLQAGELKARLGLNGVSHFATVATDGTGIFDALKTIINLIVQRIE